MYPTLFEMCESLTPAAHANVIHKAIHTSTQIQCCLSSIKIKESKYVALRKGLFFNVLTTHTQSMVFHTLILVNSVFLIKLPNSKREICSPVAVIATASDPYSWCTSCLRFKPHMGKTDTNG